MEDNNITIIPGSPLFAEESAKLIYDSSHELFEFMFQDNITAKKTLKKLYKKNKGHFSHVFSSILEMDGKVVGLELGYDKKQLSKQELIGSISLLFSSPVSLWWHLITKTGSIINGYVPKPNDDSYYINNIAVSDKCRGKGLGKKLLKNVINRAKDKEYKLVELDVTSVNENAIGFYKKNGFEEVSRSGTDELMEKYELPLLIRMAYKF